MFWKILPPLRFRVMSMTRLMKGLTRQDGFVVGPYWFRLAFPVVLYCRV